MSPVFRGWKLVLGVAVFLSLASPRAGSAGGGGGIPNPTGGGSNITVIREPGYKVNEQGGGGVVFYHRTGTSDGVHRIPYGGDRILLLGQLRGDCSSPPSIFIPQPCGDWTQDDATVRCTDYMADGNDGIHVGQITENFPPNGLPGTFELVIEYKAYLRTDEATMFLRVANPTTHIDYSWDHTTLVSGDVYDYLRPTFKGLKPGLYHVELTLSDPICPGQDPVIGETENIDLRVDFDGLTTTVTRLPFSSLQ